MGSTARQQEDTHSHQVAAATLGAIAPAWLQSGKPLSELVAAVVALLPSMLPHRRLPLLTALLAVVPQVSPPLHCKAVWCTLPGDGGFASSALGPLFIARLLPCCVPLLVMVAMHPSVCTGDWLGFVQELALSLHVCLTCTGVGMVAMGGQASAASCALPCIRQDQD